MYFPAPYNVHKEFRGFISQKENMSVINLSRNTRECKRNRTWDIRPREGSWRSHTSRELHCLYFPQLDEDSRVGQERDSYGSYTRKFG